MYGKGKRITDKGWLKALRFSIIIPVYNVEKYLGECIDSVLGQTFKDYEIILCDDGSTDGSGKICDFYRDSCSNGTVRVLHDINAGAAIARNRGIDAARGEYILFLDSDDFYIENTFLQMLSDKISEEKPDVLLFGIYYYLSLIHI